MRHAASALAGALIAGIGALVLGEYELAGLTPFVAGPLFGVLVAEVMLAVAGRATALLAVAAAALTGAGLVWAAWISSGRDWSYVSPEAWAGVALGAVAATLWVRRAGRRAAGSPPGP